MSCDAIVFTVSTNANVLLLEIQLKLAGTASGCSPDSSLRMLILKVENKIGKIEIPGMKFDND